MRSVSREWHSANLNLKDSVSELESEGAASTRSLLFARPDLMRNAQRTQFAMLLGMDLPEDYADDLVSNNNLVLHALSIQVADGYGWGTSCWLRT